MSEIDFAMTYPCYFLLTKRGNPETVISEGVRCVCLFTDSDLIEPFYKDKYGNAIEAVEIEVMPIENRESLLTMLREIEIELAEQNVYFLAIDVTPNKMVGRVLIRKFIEDLEKRDE